MLLRALSAAAAAEAAAPIGSMGTALSRVLPDAARQAAGMGIPNPKVWSADVKPMRGRAIDGEAYLRAVRVAADQRKPNSDHPLKPTIVRAGEVLKWAHDVERTGFVRRTFAQLGKLLGCCARTAQKAIRYLESHGLCDTFNVLRRDHGQVRRDANLYLIPSHGAEPDAAPAPAASSLVTRLNRYAAWFGLTPRAWGLNATPAPVGRFRRPERPVPS